jgi:hypothetical protein
VSDSAAGPGRDQVTGFDAGHDAFEFSSAVVSGPIHFIGDGNGPIPLGGETAFDGNGAEARLANVGGLTVLQVDTNGDMTADIEVQLNGLVGPLHDGNFLLV